MVGELRQIARGLRPPALDDLGLAAALRKLTSDFQARTGVGASFRVEGEGRPAADAELGLFRIAQEALNNVGRHAAAERVSVRLRLAAAEARLTIVDDGAGFTVGRAPEASLGLAGMRERAALLGGRLDVSSAPGKGATVRATIPLAEAAEPVSA